MTGLLILLYIVLIAKLIGVAAVTIPPSVYSSFELTRRVNLGDEAAQKAAQRQRAYIDLLSLQRAALSLLLVLVVVLSIILFGWIVGSIVSVVIALQYGTVAHVPFIRRQFQRLYDKYESIIMAFVQRYPSVFRVLRTASPPARPERIDSREELLHLVEQSGAVLSHDEKQLISHGLAFGRKSVASVMTPRTVIDFIKKGELLGPLVLDDLHKTGHSRFPVVDKDIDHVVGMLYLHSLLTLDTNKKHTAKVETAMDPKVHYIREDQTLDHALSAFIRTHHHLFIVINQYRETVGLLSLEDVIEALLGKKIVDEFDAHDDLKVVAERNPRRNKDSKVVLIEYGDFQCPGCGAAFPNIKLIKEKYKDQIAFVFRNFPLTSIHPNAKVAAAAAEAAGLQGKYWEMHDALFENQDQWSSESASTRIEKFESYARTVGVSDIDKFREDVSSELIASKIAFDQALGKKANVTGTPTFFLNGKQIDQYVKDGKIVSKDEQGASSIWNDAEAFGKLIIEPALKEAGIELPKSEDK